MCEQLFSTSAEHRHNSHQAICTSQHPDGESQIADNFRLLLRLLICLWLFFVSVAGGPNTASKSCTAGASV